MKNEHLLNSHENVASVMQLTNPSFREKTGIHPIITSVFLADELSMLQSAHDTIAKNKNNKNNLESLLDNVFKHFQLMVESSMHLSTKAIERHIQDQPAMWLPFHK